MMIGHMGSNIVIPNFKAKHIAEKQSQLSKETKFFFKSKVNCPKAMQTVIVDLRIRINRKGF